MDVKSVFLNGFLEEEVNIEQPMNYEGKRHKNLNKALYRLKQASRDWYSCIDGYFLENGFVKCPNEYAIYIKIKESSDTLIVYLYVDDLIFTGNIPKMFKDFKQAMTKELEITDISLMS